MMWTCWSDDLSYILRRIIITTNMEVKVFIGDKEISFAIKIIHYISEIEQILKKLQTIFPCEGVNDENRVAKCRGFVIKSEYRVGQILRCLTCTKSNLTPIQKLRKKNEILKGLDLYCKRREKRLREKIKKLYLKDIN
ncbi:PREDICTED: uncharacterized protein LOC108775961 [Cyphomyrmex costatus]|uniref:uncharacterized protein LOC108775961 n=1 Tax=Cyphomyrmex costatus TaxID=456900 RepID=UPI00085220C2|nr:PREDICTED: uncharacterized protein LOC108775961 [Cyphomyrmex costatus]